MHHSALESSLATAMSKYAKAKTNFDNSRMEIERCNAENIAFHKELKMKEIPLSPERAKQPMEPTTIVSMTSTTTKARATTKMACNHFVNNTE